MLRFGVRSSSIATWVPSVTASKPSGTRARETEPSPLSRQRCAHSSLFGGDRCAGVGVEQLLDEIDDGDAMLKHVEPAVRELDVPQSGDRVQLTIHSDPIGGDSLISRATRRIASVYGPSWL